MLVPASVNLKTVLGGKKEIMHIKHMHQICLRMCHCFLYFQIFNFQFQFGFTHCFRIQINLVLWLSFQILWLPRNKPFQERFYFESSRDKQEIVSWQQLFLLLVSWFRHPSNLIRQLANRKHFVCLESSLRPLKCLYGYYNDAIWEILTQITSSLDVSSNDFSMNKALTANPR